MERVQESRGLGNTVQGKRKRTRSRRREGKICKLSTWKPLTSQRAARRITSKFHRLTRKQEELKTELASLEAHAKRRKLQLETDLANLRKQIEECGGREKYQDASILLTDRNKSSSKWTFRSLTKLGRRPRKGENNLRVLEIGAINTQLLSCPWMDVRAIDLKSRHPEIEQLDYFALENRGEYDVVVNAMVLNCVESAPKRGEMLFRNSLDLKMGGVLILVLPRRCIDESKYMNRNKLCKLLEKLGFQLVDEESSPKVRFYCAVKREEAEMTMDDLAVAREKDPSTGSSASFAILL